MAPAHCLHFTTGKGSCKMGWGAVGWKLEGVSWIAERCETFPEIAFFRPRSRMTEWSPMTRHPLYSQFIINGSYFNTALLIPRTLLVRIWHTFSVGLRFVENHTKSTNLRPDQKPVPSFPNWFTVCVVARTRHSFAQRYRTSEWVFWGVGALRVTEGNVQDGLLSFSFDLAWQLPSHILF